MKLVKFGYLFVLLTLPLGQLSRITLAQNVVVYLNDLLIPILVLVWFVSAFGIQKKVYLPPFSFRILIFILIALLSLLLGSFKLSSTEMITSGLFLLRFIEYVFFYLIGFNLFSDQKYRQLVVKSLIFIGFIVAVFGFLQVIIIPDFSQLAAEGGWDPHQYRLLSTFFDPNFVGGFLVIILTYIISHLFFKPKIGEKIGLILFGTALLAALILTLSRSTYIALLASFGTFALIKSKKIFIAALLLVGLTFIMVPAVKERIIQAVNFDDASSARVISWQNALTIARDQPLFGVGFNTYRYVQEDYGFTTSLDGGGHSGSGVDSSLLLVLATTGIVGLLSFSAILFGLGRRAFRQRHHQLSLAFLVSLVVLLVHSQFVNALFYPQILEIFWVGAALMVVEAHD